MSSQHCRVLIVDDDPLIGELIAEILRLNDMAVIGPVCTVWEAIEAARTHEIDCALLDVTLRGGDAVPVAEELTRRSIPFIVITGRGRYETLPAALAGAPRLTKPFHMEQLIALLRAVERDRIDA